MKFSFKTNFGKEFLKGALITFCFLLSSILVETFTLNRLGLGGSPEYILFDVVFWVGISIFFSAFPAVFKIIGFSLILLIQFIISGVNTSYFYVNGNLFDLETTFQAKNGIHVATPDVFDIKMIVVMTVVLLLTITAFIVIDRLIKVDKNTPKTKSSVLLLTSIMVFSMLFSVVGNNLVYGGLKVQKYDFNVWNGIALDSAITQDDISDTAETLASEKKLYDNLYNKLSSLKKFGTFGFYVKNFVNLLDKGDDKVLEDEIINKTINYINRGGVAKIKQGTSQGNNVITVLLETGSWWGIDPYLTPNLYALSNDSSKVAIDNETMKYVADNTLKLENYYSRNSTNVSEQHMIVGSFPMTNTPYYKLYSEKAETMNFDFSFANMLKGETADIITSYLHPSTVDMYSREYTMKSFGFDKVMFIQDMEAFNSYAPYKFYNFVLDSEFFETQMASVVPSENERFYTHVTTITTHGSYLNKDENHDNRIAHYKQQLLERYDGVMEYYKRAMPTLHFPAKDGGDFFTEFVNYKSAYMDLDKAIGELFETLKTKGLLNNTTVCLFADHYCYYNDLALQIYGYDHGDIAHPDLYRIPAFIFDTKLASRLTSGGADKTKLYDFSFASPSSLLPTMFDILNIEYNTSYYLGVSIWDDNNIHNAQVSSLSGVFNMNFFSYDIFEIENPNEYTDMDYLGRRYRFFCDALYQYAKINYLDNLYTYNEQIFSKISVKNKTITSWNRYGFFIISFCRNQ